MRTLTLLALAAALASGCGSAETPEPAEGTAGEAVPAEAAPAEVAPPPAAADGALTKAQLDSYGDHAHSFQPFDKGLEALTAAYGAPMAQEEGNHYWFARDGEDCWRLSVQDMGGTVGARELKRVPECP